MLRDAAGNKLYRKLWVKIIFPDNIFPDRIMIKHAPPRSGVSPENIFAMLDEIADKLDTSFPFWEFKPQEMLPEHRTARYLISFAGYRAGTTTSQQESTTPTTESTGESVQQELTPMLETPRVVPSIPE